MLVSAIVVAAPIRSTAQTVPATFDDVRATAYRDKTVYVIDQAGNTVKGRVIEITPAAVKLLVNGAAREWRAADVSWITQRHRHAGRGAVIGAAFGALYGAFLAVTDPWDPNNVTTSDVLFCGALFGGIGAGAGAAIGFAIETEHVLYATPSRSGRASLDPPRTIGLHARLSF